jgi:hypothetical protein
MALQEWDGDEDKDVEPGLLGMCRRDTRPSSANLEAWLGRSTVIICDVTSTVSSSECGKSSERFAEGSNDLKPLETYLELA